MGINVSGPLVNTSMGMRRKNPMCWKCRKEVSEAVLMTLNVYGQPICPDCAGEPAKSALRPCGDENCTCATAETSAEA